MKRDPHRYQKMVLIGVILFAWVTVEFWCWGLDFDHRGAGLGMWFLTASLFSAFSIPIQLSIENG